MSVCFSMNDSWAAVVGVLIINAWSISLPLVYVSLSFRSLSDSYSLSLSARPSGLSLSLSLYLNTFNQSENHPEKQDMSIPADSKLAFSLSLLHYHFLSHSLFLPAHLFLLAPGLSESHRSPTRRAKERERETEAAGLSFPAGLGIKSVGKLVPMMWCELVWAGVIWCDAAFIGGESQEASPETHKNRHHGCEITGKPNQSVYSFSHVELLKTWSWSRKVSPLSFLSALCLS